MTSFYLFLALCFLVLAINISTAKRHHDGESKHHKHSKKKDKQGNGTEEELEDISDDDWVYENTTHVDSRRILFSKQTEKGRRPYMVYLQLTMASAKAHKYRGWLCGGVIVDAYYVLTSAACVEDADKFYIVSGTTKFEDSFDYRKNECICHHRRKVVWKCIPKNYKFDLGDVVKWSSNDIAIVKVNKPFKFGVLEKGCEFATGCIMYNNISRELEKPGTRGFIAGWGSGNTFREGVYRRRHPDVIRNARCLQEAKVCIMDNEQCAKKWPQKFRDIITQYMICTKDVMKRLSEECEKKYANCTDVESRRQYTSELGSQSFNIDMGRHLQDPDDYTARRSTLQGGFCENDHGGPLIVKYQNRERVVGVISACKIDPKTHSCHGPFLYTSVYRNRQFISCAIHKEVEPNCRRVFRSGITHEEWAVDWSGVKDDEDYDGPKKDAKAAEAESESSESAESKEQLRNKEGTTDEPDNSTTTSSTTAKSDVTTAKDADAKSEATETRNEGETTTTVKPAEKKDDEKEKDDDEDNKKTKTKKHKKKEGKDEKKEGEDENKGSEDKDKDKKEKNKDPDTHESSKDEAVNDPANE